MNEMIVNVGSITDMVLSKDIEEVSITGNIDQGLEDLFVKKFGMNEFCEEEAFYNDDIEDRILPTVVVCVIGDTILVTSNADRLKHLIFSYIEWGSMIGEQSPTVCLYEFENKKEAAHYVKLYLDG